MNLSVKRWGQYGFAVFEGDKRLTGSIIPYDAAIERAAALAKVKSKRKRPCLCCRETFDSEGPHNRLCNRCRTRSDTSDMGIAL